MTLEVLLWGCFEVREVGYVYISLFFEVLLSAIAYEMLCE